jgi:hypothetical protein
MPFLAITSLGCVYSRYRLDLFKSLKRLLVGIAAAQGFGQISPTSLDKEVPFSTAS